MMRAYKYRLNPNGEQKQALSQMFGCTRLLYNCFLSWWKDEYAASKSENRAMEKLPLVTFFKEEYDFLKEVDSLALMNARSNFQDALKNFFDSKKGKRKGRKVKFPKFKKKNKCRDSYSTNNQHGTVTIENGCVKLPKLGWIPGVIHRGIPENYKIKSATVSREKDGTYYVSILCETDMTPPAKRVYDKPMNEAKIVGLDMSLSEFYVSSDGGHDATRTKYVRQFRKDERKIARLNRQHSRREMFPTEETVYSRRWKKDVAVTKPSNNREKARLLLAKAYRKVANRRKDFAMQEAAYLAKNYDAVVIEDLDMQVMAKSLKLGKSVNDLGWGMFVGFLRWQCEKRGCELIVADKYFPSSKTCNHCGVVNSELKLSDREWVCPECGSIIDRDYNAACNLRDMYLRHLEKINSTAGTAETHACGDSASTPSLGDGASRVVESRSSLILQ